MTQYLSQFIKKTILCTAFTIAWTGMAQTQESGANANQHSEDQAAELGKKAPNPLSTSWQMQIEQNNNWVGMPLKMGDRARVICCFNHL